MSKTKETTVAASTLRLKWYESSKNMKIGPHTSELLQYIGLISDIYDGVPRVFEDYVLDPDSAYKVTEECRDALNECRLKLLYLVQLSIDNTISEENGMI